MLIAGILSSLLFLVTLALIFSEKINRTIVGFVGAGLMVGMGIALGFYSESQALEAVDFNTLGLLLGMMIMVALLEPTGFFQFMAVWAGRLSKGKPVRLLVMLGTVTTILSMFLDNVTTVVLIAPVAILICEILGVNPTPYLMTEAMLSNIGGVATLVGDPPNIIIGSAAGLSYLDFLANLGPIVAILLVVFVVQARWMFRGDLASDSDRVRELMSLDEREALL